MSSTSPSADATREFLNNAQLAPGVYGVGLRNRRITLYRQQMRALNLIYSLEVNGDLGSPGDRKNVVIIGAGASGMTAAVALSQVGCGVHIIERKSRPLHLQSDCMTRWLSPQLDSWPKPGSERLHAELPFMSWREGISAEVAEELIGEFVATCERRSSLIHRVFGAEPSGKRDGDRFWVSWTGALYSDHSMLSGNVPADVLIVCSGFGVDHSQGIASHSIPYWRNDDLDQIHYKSDAVSSYFVSGTGDGGLTDLLRLKFQKYSPRLVPDLLREMALERPAEVAEVYTQLEQIADQELQGRVLWEAFNGIASLPIVDALKVRLRRLTRRDTKVILNDRWDTLEESLKLGPATLVNCFTTYLLYSCDKFTYRAGEITSLRDIPKECKGRVVVRHGVDRDANYQEFALKFGLEGGLAMGNAGPGEKDVEDFDRPLFEPLWWRLIDRELEEADKEVPVGFVPPSTQALAEMVCASLASAMATDHDRADGQCRITLHRIATSKSANEVTYQQVARYHGRSHNERSKITRLGRVFQGGWGVTGLAISTGRMVALQKGSGEFDKMHRNLPPKRFADWPESVCAIPILSSAPSPSMAGRRIVGLLYLASSIPRYFDNERTRECIEIAQRTISTIDYLVTAGLVRSVPTLYSGLAEIDLRQGDGDDDVLPIFSAVQALELEIVERPFSGTTSWIERVAVELDPAAAGGRPGVREEDPLPAR
jgi:hypothetical protein